jgi:hypothetical protein
LISVNYALSVLAELEARPSIRSPKLQVLVGDFGLFAWQLALFSCGSAFANGRRRLAKKRTKHS